MNTKISTTTRPSPDHETAVQIGDAVYLNVTDPRVVEAFAVNPGIRDALRSLVHTPRTVQSCGADGCVALRHAPFFQLVLPATWLQRNQATTAEIAASEFLNPYYGKG